MLCSVNCSGPVLVLDHVQAKKADYCKSANSCTKSALHDDRLHARFGSNRRVKMQDDVDSFCQLS